MFPTSGAPMKTDAHYRVLFNISFWVPSKGALPLGPPHVVPSEREALFLEPFVHHSKFLVYEPPSSFQVPLRHKGAPVGGDAHIQSLS